jgi:hypothetical protein
MKTHPSTQEFISEVLHSLLFFEEFSFARNKFCPPGRSEVEFADAVVLLDDVLLVFQIKERVATSSSTPVGEQNWFRKKVVRDATKQIRDTLGYLESCRPILIENEQGRQFDISSQQYNEVIKIVIYRSAGNLPAACRHQKFYSSSTAGFIHIFEASDYLEMARTLRVPEDVIRYLRYREDSIVRFGAACRDLPEASMVGSFVGGEDEQAPRYESYLSLHKMLPDEETWDISSYLRSLRDHTSHPAYNDDYYAILREFSRFPRSFWREFKKRLLLCIDNVANDKFALPYRIAFPDRSVGIMLFSPDSSMTARPEWQSAKIQGLINFTELHKFDQRLRKCIGVQVAKDGDYFDIQWCMTDHEWKDDIELRKKLELDSPFRPVREAEQFSYLLVD